MKQEFLNFCRQNTLIKIDNATGHLQIKRYGNISNRFDGLYWTFAD